jgi:hypothetical protein
LAWVKITREASKKSGLAENRDINGNDFSFQSAKMRLHNLATEFAGLSVMEQAWETEHPINIMMGCHSPKKICMQYCATNATTLYNCAVKQGTISKMQENCTTFMRKRGRDWDVAASFSYPDSDSEDEELVHKYF